MYLRNNNRALSTLQTKNNQGIKCVQQKIQIQQQLTAQQKCPCSLCHTDIIKKKPEFQQMSFYSQTGKNFLKILNGLCVSSVPGLKIYFPDICFIDADMLIVFSTEHRDNRFVKISGTTPSKSIYQTMVRLKASYKNMLEENFQKNMLDKIDPKYMHQKYMNQLLPSHFHDGFDSQKLSENKNRFKQYILHKNVNYTINGIQQHKMNENQPFCVVYFNDGNSQLLTQRQFSTLVVMKVPNDVVYVQSFIKEKKQCKNIFTSQYKQFSNIDEKLFEKAETQVLILIGGIDKFSQKFQDLEDIQDSLIQLMKTHPQQYTIYSTYRIVHYLSMVSRIYVKNIKINWVLNDIGCLYIQNIFDIETTQISDRPIRFRLPPKSQNLNFYKDSERFLNLYREMQIHTQAKRLKIRQKLIKQQQQSQKQKEQTQKLYGLSLKNSRITNTQKSTVDKTICQIPKYRRLQPISQMSKTIEIDSKLFFRRKSSHNNNKSRPHGRLKFETRYQTNSINSSMPLKDKSRQRVKSVIDKYHF